MQRLIVVAAVYAMFAVVAVGQVVVTPQLVRFIDEDAGVIDLTVPGATLPAVQGLLEIDVPFVSDQLDPVTGLYWADRIGASWAIEWGAPSEWVTHLPDGTWFGRSARLGAQELRAFDASTGVGVVRVTLPIATSLARGGPTYPALPDGPCTVHLALDWIESLAFDAQGAPSNPEWVGSVTVVTDLPTCSVRVGPRELQLDRTAFAEVVFDGPLLTSLDVSLRAEPDYSVTVTPATFTVPAGAEVALFEITGAEVGDFRVVVEIAGSDAASSVLRRVSEPTRFAASSLQSPVSSGPPPLKTGLFKKCSPPAAQGGTNGIDCGGCVWAGTPHHECVPDAGGVKDAYCYRSLFTTCVAGPDTTVSSDVFQPVNPPLIEDCSVSGGVKVGGSLGDIGGNVQPKKLCCIYVLDPSAGKIDIVVHTCAS